MQWRQKGWASYIQIASQPCKKPHGYFTGDDNAGGGGGREKFCPGEILPGKNPVPSSWDGENTKTGAKGILSIIGVFVEVKFNNP